MEGGWVGNERGWRVGRGRRGWWPLLVPETYLPVAGSVNMHPVLSNSLSSWPPSRGGRAAAVAATEVESTSAQRCSLPQMVQKNRCCLWREGGLFGLGCSGGKRKTGAEPNLTCSDRRRARAADENKTRFQHLSQNAQESRLEPERDNLSCLFIAL